MAKRSSDEARVAAEIELAIGRGDCRLLRNNVGALRTSTGRFVAFGLGSKGGQVFRGSHDYVGWRSVVVTPEMVGRRIAIFASIDAKDLEKPSPDQIIFAENVGTAGGLTGFAHSADEAMAIMFPDWLPPALR